MNGEQKGAERVIAIGASTGGPSALQQLLPTLPANLPAAILVVQHMPSGFTGPLSHHLDSMCQLAVEEAKNETVVRQGFVYIAPAGLHLTVTRDSRRNAVLRLAREPSGTLHVPSVDVMMASVAKLFGRESVGVILTGMGQDGALGMRAIFEAGGITMGQDEGSCAIYGMPKACAQLRVLSKVVALEEMAEHILAAVGYRRENSFPGREQHLQHLTFQHGRNSNAR